MKKKILITGIGGEIGQGISLLIKSGTFLVPTIMAYDLIANANDIIEWTGSKWQIVFDASETSTVSYVSNLTTNIQYRWDGTDWLKSVDGLYPRGTWRLALEG